MEKHTKVYLVQETGRHNFEPAKAFGSIKVLLPFGYQMGIDAEYVVEKIHEGLEDIEPDDYLLLAGDPALIGLTTAVAADYLDGKVNLLKWDRQEKTYIPITCSLYGE